MRMTDGDIARAAEGSLVPATGQTDLERFESGVRGLLDQVGLPTEELFVGVQERKTLITNLPAVVTQLPDNVRVRSRYISKMVAASSVGLFDAALNYLWDELVSELRARIAGFDLSYFFDIAAGSNNDLRKNLRDESDLTSIDDAHLLRAAMNIGLLTDVGFARLDHIRFMRNHASAAHPNQNTLSGLDLVNYLQICIREVINTPPDTVAASTGRLLANIKTAVLDATAVNEAAIFFNQLPADRADTLGNGLFGLYTSPDRTAVVADNVRLLWPKLWPFIGESTRYSYGLRQARASAIADTGMAAAGRELLDLIDGGNAYLTPEMRALDIRDALDVLASAHHGMNNFYNEPAPARRLISLVGPTGDVPDSVRNDYVLIVLECYLGNGYGVSAAAATHYQEMIQRFSSHDAGIALRACLTPVFSSLFATSVGRHQWQLVLDMLEPKMISRPDRDLMTAIRAFTGSPDQLRLDTRIRELAARPPASDTTETSAIVERRDTRRSDPCLARDRAFLASGGPTRRRTVATPR